MLQNEALFKYNLRMAKNLSLEFKAEELGKSLENLGPVLEMELRDAVANLANAAYTAMVAQVQQMSMDPKNRQDYLRGLNLEPIGNDSFLLSLDGEWANKLEQGFPAYDMKPGLLGSNKKVSVGSRAGQDWVRKSAKGTKYAAVPFEHKPFSAQNFSSGDLAKDIKKLQAANQSGKMQKLTKVFKDPSGNPLSGKVASVGATSNPNLAGITKYQFVHESGRVSSVYLTYRMVSSNSAGWQHPGFAGYGLFKKVEEYVDSELENIVNTLL